jgi:hypothetical protein
MRYKRSSQILRHFVCLNFPRFRQRRDFFNTHDHSTQKVCETPCYVGLKLPKTQTHVKFFMELMKTRRLAVILAALLSALLCGCTDAGELVTD